jgi:hypothetical protein
VDNEAMTIRALGDDDLDHRAFSLAVAGPAALVVAKTHKIAGRRDEGRGRLKDKDALDVYRLLRAVEPSAFSAGFERLLASDRAAASTRSAVREFEVLFAESAGVGVDMAVRATELLVPEAEVRVALPLLAQELLRAADVTA